MASTTPSTTIGIKQVAEKLNVPPVRLRAFIRTLDADLSVGRGAKYAWPTMSDPAVKRIMREWTKAHTEPKTEES